MGPEGGTAALVGPDGAALSQRGLFVILTCLARFWTWLEPVIPLSFQFLLLPMGPSLLYLSSYCILEACNLPGFTDSQLERIFVCVCVRMNITANLTNISFIRLSFDRACGILEAISRHSRLFKGVGGRHQREML